MWRDVNDEETHSPVKIYLTGDIVKRETFAKQSLKDTRLGVGRYVTGVKKRD